MKEEDDPFPLRSKSQSSDMSSEDQHAINQQFYLGIDFGSSFDSSSRSYQSEYKVNFGFEPFQQSPRIQGVVVQPVPLQIQRQEEHEGHEEQKGQEEVKDQEQKVLRSLRILHQIANRRLLSYRGYSKLRKYTARLAQWQKILSEQKSKIDQEFNVPFKDIIDRSMQTKEGRNRLTQAFDHTFLLRQAIIRKVPLSIIKEAFKDSLGVKHVLREYRYMKEETKPLMPGIIERLKRQLENISRNSKQRPFRKERQEISLQQTEKYLKQSEDLKKIIETLAQNAYNKIKHHNTVNKLKERIQTWARRTKTEQQKKDYRFSIIQRRFYKVNDEVSRQKFEQFYNDNFLRSKALEVGVSFSVFRYLFGPIISEEEYNHSLTIKKKRIRSIGALSRVKRKKRMNKKLLKLAQRASQRNQIFYEKQN